MRAGWAAVLMLVLAGCSKQEPATAPAKDAPKK